MSRRTKWILGIVALLVVAAGAAYGIQARKPKGMKVRTTKVEKKDLTSLVTANGTLQARTKVDISANIMGQIVQLNVEEGDRVDRGDLLLVIDPTRYNAAVQSRSSGMEALVSQVERTRETAALAQRDFERAQRQHTEGILSAADMDRAKSAWDQQRSALQAAERQVSQARAELAAARDELAKTEIRAPMNGVVTRRNVENGEVVVTGTMNNPGTVLMTISDMAEIEASLEVDQTDIPILAIGQPATVLIDAFPDRPFPGTVTEIGSSPIQGTSALGGAATGTDYEVKVTLLEAPEGVRPGLTVTADIVTDTRTGVLAVPVGALILREEGSKGAAAPAPKPGEEPDVPATTDDAPASVASRGREVEGIYLLEAGKAVFRPVTTGAKGEMDLEILSGLQGGEEVIVGPFKALRELKPGDPVQVDNSLGQRGGEEAGES